MKSNLLVICFYFLLINSCFAQINHKNYNILFYNLENLFDTKDNPVTDDDEYTPGGAKHWTFNRLNKKLSNLSKVILNASGWIPPDLIAVCEVENRYVLEKLIKDTPLVKYPYKIIHKESPDPRGIDVALLYNDQTFFPLEYDYIPLTNEKGNIINSREILYVNGIIDNNDTLHIFINHWPSRYRGILETTHARKRAAIKLRHLIMQAQKKYTNPKIVITGDFNDQPSDESLMIHLNAEYPAEQPSKTALYNLSFEWMKDEVQTLKHQSQWNVFDQFIVSGSLLTQNKSLYTSPDYAQILNLPFLTETDYRYGNIKLNRTYNGYKYHGGFSDHLPVLLKLKTAL